MSRKARKHGRRVEGARKGSRILPLVGQKTNVGDPNASGPSGAKGSKGGK